MKKYIVMIKGILNSRSIVVEAETFNHNIVTRSVIFIDKEGNNVAMFDSNKVEYIRQVEVSS